MNCSSHILAPTTIDGHDSTASKPTLLSTIFLLSKPIHPTTGTTISKLRELRGHRYDVERLGPFINGWMGRWHGKRHASLPLGKANVHRAFWQVQHQTSRYFRRTDLALRPKRRHTPDLPLITNDLHYQDRSSPRSRRVPAGTGRKLFRGCPITVMKRDRRINQPQRLSGTPLPGQSGRISGSRNPPTCLMELR